MLQKTLAVVCGKPVMYLTKRLISKWSERRLVLFRPATRGGNRGYASQKF